MHQHRWSRLQAYAESRRKSPAHPEVHRKEVPTMPTNKEFTIRLEDRPGTLGKLCQALADQSVNILAFHSCPIEKDKSAVRLVLDNPSAAKSMFDRQKTDYTETEVVRVTLTHRPGELARAASRLGEAGINIDYGYCGVEGGESSGAGRRCQLDALTRLRVTCMFQDIPIVGSGFWAEVKAGGQY